MTYKIHCPKEKETKRPHTITMIGDLLFECSCGEIITLAEEDIKALYGNIAKAMTKHHDTRWN